MLTLAWPVSWYQCLIFFFNHCLAGLFDSLYSPLFYSLWWWWWLWFNEVFAVDQCPFDLTACQRAGFCVSLWRSPPGSSVTPSCWMSHDWELSLFFFFFKGMGAMSYGTQGHLGHSWQNNIIFIIIQCQIWSCSNFSLSTHLYCWWVSCK